MYVHIDRPIGVGTGPAEELDLPKLLSNRDVGGTAIDCRKSENKLSSFDEQSSPSPGKNRDYRCDVWNSGGKKGKKKFFCGKIRVTN
jgi:hypothetical protein